MLIVALTAALLVAPVKVEIVKQGDSFQLLRDGQPYFIKGAGGSNNFATLKRAGGNSLRTWGAENLWGQLGEAQALGLTVTVGIWLGHKRHGFDYNDPAKLASQTETTRNYIGYYRNHPAVLMWALGNEMENGDSNSAAIWKHIGELAKMAKKLDPNHPVMSVVAEISPEKIADIKKYAPDLDLLGVNSYAGLPTLGKRLKEFGWEKPWVVTEHGPAGQWEAPKTSWGATIEPTSTEKGKIYADMYNKGIAAHKGWNLGSYVFLWGEKQEETATWFGMFLRTGEALASVETMASIWGGTSGPNRAPVISAVKLTGDNASVKPGASLEASVDVADPDKDVLQFDWLIQPEQNERLSGGQDEKRLEEIRHAISGSGPKVKVTVPTVPGNYRLMLYIHDGQGKAATGNIPFRVVP